MSTPPIPTPLASHSISKVLPKSGSARSGAVVIKKLHNKTCATTL